MKYRLIQTIVSLALLFLLTAPAPAAERQTLPGHVPTDVAKLNLQPLGRLSATTRLNLGIGLPLHNRGALTNLLKQLYSPSSTNFHRYLTPPEFTERFGPTTQEYQAVKDFALSNRLVVESTYGNRALLDVSGAVAEIEAAFHITLRTYRHPTENREFYAPDVEPTVDASLPILEIDGLDNYVLPHPGGLGVGTTNMGPGVTPGGGSATNGDLLGYDFRNAYAPGVNLDGTGQTVALLELDGFYQSDIAEYESVAGLPSLVPTVVKVGGFSGNPSTNSGAVSEVSLDIEMAIAMAPGLQQVLVYEGSNGVANISATILNRIAMDNLASQISCSWFIGRSSNYDNSYMQFAAQGQSIFQCSGDARAYLTNGVAAGPKAGQPAGDPYLTSVGGTILNTASDHSYQSERVWTNNDGITGSGGGYVVVYTIPMWQQGVDMSVNHGSTIFRNFPDVCMVADHCYVISNNGHVGSFWGTSLAAPLWAGFTALVNQQAVADGKPPVGFLNPAIYAIAQSPLYASCFHDITNGNNTWSNSPTAYSPNYYALPGYDLCTGWGSPNGSNLINALVGYAGPKYVDFNYTGPFTTGSYDYPFKTLAAGTNAVAPGGTIIIRTAGSSSETMTIAKPMTVTAIGGAATIGH